MLKFFLVCEMLLEGFEGLVGSADGFPPIGIDQTEKGRGLLKRDSRSWST